eukprot:gnl/MRDRNA2_/MRDRNA2_90769_c0_seq1.p1 gnl/MRDRNA2_/MRDRNA2_90769_c0~~gnl/MRDRNA2_/MRDRNA2_90769_c0_seq1.p1  ORF type:complete len:957 (+),score=196.04 gnl/MRDRNA2_/MRDRNA2_90769_c0_seq1:77-2947(+)
MEPDSDKVLTQSNVASAEGNALTLHWTLGLNKDVVGGVHNLSDAEASDMFYAAAHTGVIFDYNTGVQRLLQGHVNPITATAVSQDKKWIVTADTGPDSMLVVWERDSGTPVKTVFSPHPYGVHALDITPDAKYLVTISAPMPAEEPTGPDAVKGKDDSQPPPECQSISVWNWYDEREGPLCTALVGTQDIQTCVLFNAWDIHEIGTNGKRRVFFWTWDDNQPFQFYSPALAARDFKQRIGDYTQTIFLPESTQAATGTVDGDVVIWDLSLIVDGLSRPDERRAVKIIKLCPDVSLNVLQVHTPFVVVGASDGAVRFYDYQFRVQAWFEDLSAGAVKSISFELSTEDRESEDFGGAGAGGGGGAEDDFKCPNFLVGTGSALVVLVESQHFYELSPDDRRGRLVLQGLDSQVYGLSCHPSLPLVAVCGYSGFLHLWNYNTRSLHLVKIFEKLVPHTLRFSPNGNLLAVGFTNGHCKLLKSDDLSEVVSFRDSRECVTHVCFSYDSAYLAIAHYDRCVCLYRYAHRHNDKSYPIEWTFSAKHRSHWRAIVGLCFSGPESDKLRLFSVGEDRRLVEYNVKQSTEFTGLQIVTCTIVEQEARPTGCLWYPFGGKGDNQKVLTMNDEYKFKIWNVNNKSCRKTALSPTYGGPISKMQPVYKDADGEDQFMLYATYEKVLGLVQLPLDGNPNKCMGLIAHPGQIASISVDYQGKYAFTCGGSDLTVNQWLIDPQPVSCASMLGGSGIEPFVKLLDGGEEGEFFSDMKDYFYYSQILSQDENTTKARTLDGTIPVEEIPHLMCALGYFPTQLEIKNMTNEVKYSKFSETGFYVDRIGFDDLVKLYVNHRPVFAVGPGQIQQAFEAMKRHESGPLPKEQFLQLLARHGEKMGQEELEQCLEALRGDASIHNVLDDEIDGLDFAHNILGLGDTEDADEEYMEDPEGMGADPTKSMYDMSVSTVPPA